MFKLLLSIGLLLLSLFLFSATIGIELDNQNTAFVSEPESAVVYSCPETKCAACVCESVAVPVCDYPPVQLEQEVICPLPDMDRCLAGGDGVVKSYKSKCSDNVYRWTNCTNASLPRVAPDNQKPKP